MRWPIVALAAVVGLLPFLLVPLAMWVSPGMDRPTAWHLSSGTVACAWFPLWLLIGVGMSAWSQDKK